MNIQFLKENADLIDLNTLSPIERSIVSFYKFNDFDSLLLGLDELSDSEAFVLLFQILEENDFSAIAFIESRKIETNNPKIDLFLSKKNILWKIDQKIENSFLELDIKEFPIILSTTEDKISINVLNQVNDIFDQLKSIEFKNQSIISWKNAQRMMGVAVLGLSLSSCGKEVTTSHVNLNNPGETSPLPIIVQEEFKTLNFTNNGDESLEIPSAFEVQQESTFTILDSISTSFKKKMNISSFTLVINDNEFVCGFLRVGENFVPHETCIRELSLIPGDKMKIIGIPNAETVSILFKIKSN